ncbi:MAG: M15 family metallopeptidase, partial [Oscillospiraceae bacterium]
LDWATTLVNQTNPLPEGYTIETRRIKGTEKDYDVRAADSLEAMLLDAEKAGFKMYLVSTYRTVAYQQGLFDRKINEYKNAGYDDATAREEAAKWVAVPGYSEHNLGLAADIVSSTWYNNNSDLTAEFENTKHFEWLVNNCTKYGFILRYPKGKESITGITYEPWHYRYVGVEAAKYITENNITLEEFHG